MSQQDTNTLPAYPTIHTAIVCPHCNKRQMFSGDYRGVIVFCPICKKQIEILGFSEGT